MFRRFVVVLRAMATKAKTIVAIRILLTLFLKVCAVILLQNVATTAATSTASTHQRQLDQKLGDWPDWLSQIE